MNDPIISQDKKTLETLLLEQFAQGNYQVGFGISNNLPTLFVPDGERDCVRVFRIKNDQLLEAE